MTPPGHDPARPLPAADGDDEARLSAWLADLDDALRNGNDTTRLVDAPDAKGSRQRLLRDLDCLELLRKRWPQPGGATPAANAPAPGKIGRFTIVRELGHGGSGVVFLAQDPMLRRDVALKVPRVNVLASATLRSRFEDEARAAALLDHPSIAPVYETGQAGPVTYIASAYCPGVTLDQWVTLRGAPVPDAQAAELLVALADAVQHAHGRGVLHRDLKPGNVIIDPDALVPVPRITDFGLAKVLADAEVAHTCSGAIIGTPGYMSPEQAAGDVAAITTATDVYGLGAILYHLLTGAPPFNGDGALQTMRRVESEEPRRPSSVRPGISIDLESICLKCLHKDPARRYGTAAALAADLRRFRAREPVEARPVTQGERVRRWCGRNRAVASLVSAVVALLVVVAVGAPVAAFLLFGQRNAARNARSEALDRLWDASLARAGAARRLERPGRRFDSLAAIEQAARIRPSLELRNEAVACFPLADVRLLRRWQAAPEGWAYLGADATLDHYAITDAAGNVSVRATADGREVAALAATGGRPTGITAGPGSLFALRCPGDAVYVRDWRTGATPVRLPMPPAPTASYHQAFSRDGRVLWAALDDGTIRRVNVADGTELPPLTFGGIPALFALSPDGRMLAVILWNSREVLLLDAETGAQRRTLAASSHPASGLAWSADGRRLAAGSGDSRIYVWDIDSQSPPAVLAGHENVVMGCTFHPGAPLLVSTGWDGQVRLWNVDSTQQVLSLDGQWPQLSGDGTRMLVPQGRDAELWELSPGDTQITFRDAAAHGIGPLSVSVHPSGRWLATDGDDGVRVWELETGRQVLHLSVGRARMTAFDPGGEHLITSGENGIIRWRLSGEPVRAKIESEISAPALNQTAALSGDGRFIAILRSPSHVEVLDAADRTAKAVVFSENARADSVSISHDGRWVATCTQHGERIKVWDAATGALLADLPAAGNSRAIFSADGRTLLTSSDGRAAALWETSTWSPRLELGHGSAAAISPDGSLAAVIDRHRVRLFSTSSGEELVTLEPPQVLPVSCVRFTPDGSRLVAGAFSAKVTHTVHVWDLARLRRRLGGMNLAW